MEAIVLLSGGLDSATCLALAVDRFGRKDVMALTMYYGQKHEKEIECARALARHYGVKQIEYDLSKIFETSNCSLLKQSSEEIPEESYSEQLKKQNGKPVSTYVPFRNGLFLSVAASVAVANDASIIYYGAHADDAAGNAYPDCSEMFNHCMEQAIFEGTGNTVILEGPFVASTKADVVKIGLELKVPYELTWSCYEGGKEPCGKCGTCIDRAKAFEANGVKDPLMSK